MIVVTPEQMKYLEAKADSNGNSYENLMEIAGRSLADRLYIILKKNHKNDILFLCGNGNNGGDCFVAARYLTYRNINCVIAMLCGEPKTDISKINYEKLKDMEIIYDLEEIKNKILLNDYDLIADGVFGTGFHGEIPLEIREIFEVCKNAQIVGVDVPSGGNCKTGYVSKGALSANETLTFGFQKFGMTQYPLKSYCGDINIADIGISESYTQDFEYIIKQTDLRYASGILPPKAADSHKGKFGRLFMVCGSESMPGACIMAAEAAARSGVGLLEIAAPKSVLSIVASRLPEATLCSLDTDSDGFISADNYNKILSHLKKASAVLVGCGIGVTENTKMLIKKLVCDIDCPIIIDADGINCIADSIDIIKQNRSGIILTPHPAEMGRLVKKTAAEVQSDRLNTALEFSREFNVITVLKGAGTIIAQTGKAFINPTGNPGMGKGGSGDVLSGIIGSLTAQNINMFDSSVLGAFLHGLAGDIAAEKLSMQSMIATDIIKNLPDAFKIIKE